ncbi:unnamed protein product [Moneuplotes crassus]|uniref:Uncharacterized protein n=1 Tax=Euplotes crassus TaxID=5936 RepID=A0AAD1UUR4_EUPCR|nr:unnamed protein product [Moneuplotes crassus]
MANSTLIGAKIAFIVVVYILAFVSGILPNVIPWCKKSTNILGIANAFSGGVFIAIALMHILPETSSGYNEYMQSPKELGQNADVDGEESGEPFPLPHTLAFVGYAFILLIDKVIFDTHSLIGDNHQGHVHDPAAELLAENVRAHLNEKLIPRDSHLDPACIRKAELLDEDIRAYLSRNDKFSVRMHYALKHPNSKKDRYSKSFTQELDKLEEPSSDLDRLLLNEEECKETKKSRCSCSLTPVVLMIALSTHAMFEGIATGLVDEVSQVWTYIIAIFLHKWAAAMSLGISMSRNFKDEKCTMYILILIFAFATPLGVLLGMIVEGSSEIAEIIFSSLAAGTFIYIACSEVIVEEFSIPKFKWPKMFAFLFGAGVIASLALLE